LKNRLSAIPQRNRPQTTHLMTQNPLINLIADRLQENSLKKYHLETIVETTLEVFIDSLAKEGRIEIRDFGVFAVKKTPEKIGRNPKTKETAIIPAINFVQFKAGKVMKERVGKKNRGRNLKNREF